MALTDSSNHSRSCPSCGSGHAPDLPGYEAALLKRCAACGTVFAGCVPGDQQLAEHYDSYPPNYVPHPLTWLRYDELLNRFESVRQTNRLLDFGSGHGYFLEAAGRHGWEACGVELADQFVAAGREKGFTITRSLEEQPNSAFDVVTALEVIEHVDDPLQQCKLIGGKVRPGGWLYLTTPNFGSLSRRLLRNRWRAISYPEHLNYFTPQSLRAMVERSGLRCHEVRTSGLSVSDLMAGRAASGSKPGRFDTTVRTAVQHRRGADTAVRGVNAGLSALGLGDTIKALFERPG